MKRNWLLGLTASLVLSFAALGGCAGSEELQGNDGSGPGAGQGGGSSSGGEASCEQHDCSSDADCGGCTDGRVYCATARGVCVACGPDGMCPAGQVCSSFGQCEPLEATCPTDAQGQPTFACSSNADCAACNPAHQVCDTASGKCTQCTPTNTAACANATDVCVDNHCQAECPAACTVDTDCTPCGAPTVACNAGKCAECSATYPCPGGEVCDAGTCKAPLPCGVSGQAAEACSTDADCGGCAGNQVECHLPINGGQYGTCGVEPAGCSDFGPGTVSLPSPWSGLSNTCSSDGDCAGIGIQYNVGKALRDVSGLSSEIVDDANVFYGMSQCLAFDFTDDLSCGVCVPCSTDADCAPIDVDNLTGDLFPGITGFAAQILLDQIFGNASHQIHMQCTMVGDNYGVCSPCPGLFSACGS